MCERIAWPLAMQMLCKQIAQLKHREEKSCETNGIAALSFDELFIHTAQEQTLTRLMLC